MNDGAGLHARRYQTLNASRHLMPFVDHSTLDSRSTRVMVRGQGMHVWDSNGKRYLDAVSGLFCTALGYGSKELVEAAARQMETLSFCSMYFNTVHPALGELTEKLFSLLPPGYARVLYTCSGSEANDVLLRVVRHHWQVMGKPRKKNFISREDAYHGSTVGSASLGGMKSMHFMGGLPIPGIHHIGKPYWYGYSGELTEEEFGLAMARQLEEKILELGAETVAAFVAEPIQAAGGGIMAPQTYWPEIQRICRKYDVLLCLDEVVGGFGRCGEWFSHQLFGLEPDTITVAKGLTSGYVPMGGLILSENVAEAMVEGGGLPHGFTYQGHPLAAAVAHANLSLLSDGGIVEQVRTETGPYLQQSLRQAFSGHPLIGEIQGAGAFAALQLTQAGKGRQRLENAAAIAAYCAQCGEDAGLLFRPVSGRIILAPALIAARADIDNIVHGLRDAVDQTARALL